MAENKSGKKGSKGCLSIFCLLPAAGIAFMLTAAFGIQPQSIGGIIAITLVAIGAYVACWLAVYIPNYNLFEGIRDPTPTVTLRPELIAKREHSLTEEQSRAAAAARQHALNEGYYYNVIRKRNK